MLHAPPTTKPLRITGARALVDGVWSEEPVAVEDGRITADRGGIAEWDARGLLLLPGIVDIHGDAFERAVQPRPRVEFPLDLALGECDGWLLAAGVTTYLMSVTDSVEPGLRSRATLRRLMSALDGAGRHRLQADWHIHIRHETTLVEGHDELLAWIREGRPAMLSIADHLPLDADDAEAGRYHRAALHRTGASPAELDALIRRGCDDREQGREQGLELAVAARAAGIPLASHDDDCPAQAAASAARGCTVAEFPLDAATARAAREQGMGVLVGAPNLVRGRSHIGALGAADAVRMGLADALCSDYHFASLCAAPSVLADQEILPFERAWDLVSAGPARLAGLHDRGSIRPGLRADLLLVEPGPQFRLRAVLVAGRLVASFA
jgi:alpha-D-ribose 1-methylphosphonate 5-triphosphate diphosphatase